MKSFVQQETLQLSEETGARDICSGADPYIFKSADTWHLLLQDDRRSDPEAHDGLTGYTIRTAPSIDALGSARALPLCIAKHDNILREVWAAEIHFDKYLYVAASNGNNHTHRMHVYETDGDVSGTWHYRGKVRMPREDHWAIDMTIVSIPRGQTSRLYAVWSGWNDNHSNFPQNIYIAEFISPYEIGPRYLIALPQGDWSTSVAPLLEGPQAIVIDNTFRGLLVTGNASWTDTYMTRVLKYKGGDPLHAESWNMSDDTFLPHGHGIGHGMIIEEGEKLYYVGHRKTTRNHGWEDRVVFYIPLDRDTFISHL
jgi:hypothetical protein